jgi:hypothetical protein
MSAQEQERGLPEKQKDPKIFDMIVIVGLVFNALIAIFLILYWFNLL